MTSGEGERERGGRERGEGREGERGGEGGEGRGGEGREGEDTHIKQSISLIIHFIGRPPSLHPLPLEKVISLDLCVGSRELGQSAVISRTHWKWHVTEVEVHRTCGGGGARILNMYVSIVRSTSSPMKSSGLKRSLSHICSVKIGGRWRSVLVRL